MTHRKAGKTRLADFLRKGGQYLQNPPNPASSLVQPDGCGFNKARASVPAWDSHGYHRLPQYLEASFFHTPQIKTFYLRKRMSLAPPNMLVFLTAGINTINKHTHKTLDSVFRVDFTEVSERLSHFSTSSYS